MAPVPKEEIQNEQNGNAVKTGREQQSSGCFGGAAAVAGGKIKMMIESGFCLASCMTQKPPSLRLQHLQR